MTTTNPATVFDRIVIPHTAFIEAEKRIEQCLTYSDGKLEAEGLAIVGESGTGKTSVLRRLRSKHRPTRTGDGMVVPILCASVEQRIASEAPRAKNPDDYGH